VQGATQRRILCALEIERMAEISACFSPEHFSVTAVTTCAEALNQAHLAPFDAALVSITFPDSLDLLAQLSQQENPPVGILVAFEETAALLEGFQTGVDDVFLAPLNRPVIRYRLDRMFTARDENLSLKREAKQFQADMTSFHHLFAAVPLGIAFYDIHGKPMTLNSRFKAILGWDNEPSHAKRKILEYPQLGAIAAQAYQGEQVSNLEIAYQRSSTETVDISVSAMPIYNAGEMNGIVLALYDISEHKRAQLAEHEERIFAEALRETASTLVRTLDEGTVFAQILESVGRVVPHEAANVMLLENGQLRPAYWRGYGDTFSEYLQKATFPLERLAALNTVITSGETVIVNDSHKYPPWVKLPGRDWVRSVMCTPLKAYDRVIGVLNLDSDKPGAFTDRDAERLRAFADQAAMALENAQLYDAIYRDAAKMRSLNRATSSLLTTTLYTANNVKELCEHITQIVVQEFQEIDCGIILLEESEAPNQLLHVARAGEYVMHERNIVSMSTMGVIPQAIRTGTTFYAPNVALEAQYLESDPRTQSELVLPLRGTHGVFGVIDIQSQKLNAFAEEDIRILEAFAERASTIIENLMLYQEIQHRVIDRTVELNRVKERAEAILNHSSDAILLLRPDGRIQQANHAFNGLFGFAPDEVYNKTFDVFAGPYYAEILRQTLEDVIDHEHPARLEITADRSNGTSFDADVVISPIPSTSDLKRVSSIVLSLRDITIRKQHERELRDSLTRERELNELKSQFISRASHEFRTPLMMITAAADLLKTHSDRMTPAKRGEKLTGIYNQVQRITGMLDDLLTLSRAQELGNKDLDFKPTDLYILCQEVVNEVQDTIGQQHTIEYVSPDPGIFANVDGDWLQRALLNLLSNAIKYSPETSLIQVHLSQDEADAIIRIQDEGIGISDEDQERLFEPFHRGQNVEHISGTGLGLSIVREAIELHGGEISVQSSLGVGSSFTIRLPLLAVREQA